MNLPLDRPNSPRLRTAVVPAAGLGTRLRPLTSGVLPKEMLPVGRRLALEIIVDELRAAGIERIVFVLSPTKEPLIRRHFGEVAGGTSLAYAIQPEMRGLGDAVLHAAPFIDSAEESFLIALGDAVFEEPVAGGLSTRLMASGSEMALVVQRVPRERLSRYGVIAPKMGIGNADEAFAIRDIIEKPPIDEAPSEFAAAARYVVPSRIFGLLRDTPPSKNGEVQLTDALRRLLAEGASGTAVPLRSGEVRHDLGGMDSYFRAFVTFATRDAEFGPGFADWLRSFINEHEIMQETSGS